VLSSNVNLYVTGTDPSCSAHVFAIKCCEKLFLQPIVPTLLNDFADFT